MPDGSGNEEAIGKLADGETYLERAPEIGGRHPIQMVLNLALPSAALMVAIVIYLMLEASTGGALLEFFSP